MLFQPRPACRPGPGRPSPICGPQAAQTSAWTRTATSASAPPSRPTPRPPARRRQLGDEGRLFKLSDGAKDLPHLDAVGVSSTKNVGALAAMSVTPLAFNMSCPASCTMRSRAKRSGPRNAHRLDWKNSGSRWAAIVRAEPSSPIRARTAPILRASFASRSETRASPSGRTLWRSKAGATGGVTAGRAFESPRPLCRRWRGRIAQR